MGCGVEYKPKGYVIALFHAFNQSQSILLDYTRIGEVVQLKGPGEYLDTSDAGEEVEKSPYSSLDGVVSIQYLAVATEEFWSIILNL